MKHLKWIAVLVLLGATATATWFLASQRTKKPAPSLPFPQEQSSGSTAFNSVVSSDLSRLMPTGAVAVIYYRGGEQLKSAYEHSALGRIFNDPQMQEFLRKPKAAAYRQISSQTNAPSAETVEQFHRWLIAKESVLAVYAGDKAGVVGCVRLGVDAPKGHQLISQSLKGTSSGTRTFKTYQVTAIAGNLEYAMAKDVFAFASDSQGMDAILERIDSGAPTSQPLSAPTLEVGEKIGWAVLDTPLALQKARAALKDSDSAAKFDAVVKELGAARLGPIEFAVGFDGPAIRTAARMPGLTAGRGVLAVYGGAPLDDAPLKMIPRDVASANVARIHLSPLWDVVMRIVEAAAGPDGFQQFQTALAKFESEANVRLKGELIDSTGDVACFYTKPGPMPMAGGEIVMALSLKDPQTFSQAMNRLLDYASKQLAANQRPGVSVSIQRSKVGDVDVSYLGGMPMFSPAFAVSGQQAFLAISPVALNAAIAQASHSQSSLLDNPDYQNARAKLPEKVFAVSYEDSRQLVAGLYGMVGMIGPMFAGKSDPPIDLALLPPLSSIQDKLFGGVAVVTIEGGELKAQQYSAIGVNLNSFAGGGAPILAAMLLPALNQAREKARRVNCMSNLKQVGLACIMYADKHSDKFPDDLNELIGEFLPSPKILHCPSAPGEQGTSYVYIRGLTTKSTDKILAYDANGNHRGIGRSVLFCDGHVQWMTEAEFQKLLQKQLYPRSTSG
jgi:prepilin-type processing-associated H-X9-DG protein